MNAVCFENYLQRCRLSEFELARRLRKKGVPPWLIGELPNDDALALLASTLNEIARESKMHPAFGPVKLYYSSRPPAQPGVGTISCEDFTDTNAALRRVRALWGRDGFNNPRITDGQAETIWWEADLVERWALLH
jgi:hypothetical protein